jgi:hypothetical protein
MNRERGQGSLNPLASTDPSAPHISIDPERAANSGPRHGTGCPFGAGYLGSAMDRAESGNAESHAHAEWATGSWVPHWHPSR